MKEDRIPFCDLIKMIAFVAWIALVITWEDIVEDTKQLLKTK